MSYGLYDGDLHLYPQVPFFNLELMKYATYYKRKREIVVFTPKFNPSMYSNYLVRQDYPSRRPYSTQYKNIVYGGRAFDGESYKPLPLDIELCKPDITIYNKLENKVITNNTTKNSFNTMRRAEHLRLSLDGKTINPQWEKQLRKDPERFGVIFHDYDLGAVDGAYELIEHNLPNLIAHKSGARIGMKFPVQTNTEEELLMWLQLLPLNQYYSLQYNGILTTTYATELKENRTYSGAQRQIVINVTGNTTSDEFITTGIVELLKSTLDLRRYRLVFPLKYDKAFFADYRWIEVLELFDFFISHINKNLHKDFYFNNVVPYETFYSSIKKETKKDKFNYMPLITKQQAQRVFQFVREHNYELFQMFYEYTGELS